MYGGKTSNILSHQRELYWDSVSHQPGWLMTSDNECLEGYKHSWWQCKLWCLLLRSVWRFFRKLKIEVPYNPTIPPLGVNQKESKSAHHRDTFTFMLIAASFPAAKTWDQCRCPSTDERNRKVRFYIYRIEFYSTIKRNGSITFFSHVSSRNYF